MSFVTILSSLLSLLYGNFPLWPKLEIWPWVLLRKDLYGTKNDCFCGLRIIVKGSKQKSANLACVFLISCVVSEPIYGHLMSVFKYGSWCLWNQFAVYILSKEERGSRRVTPAYMSIKKSQAIVKLFIDLKFSVWFTGLRKRNHVLWPLELFSASSFLVPLSSLSAFLFPLSSFLFPLSSFLFPPAGHLVFWKSWPSVDLKKVLSVTKHGFVFWAQRKPNARLEIYKAFQDRLTFLNRHTIVWIGWDS